MMTSGFTDVFSHRTPDALMLQTQLKKAYGDTLPLKLLEIDVLQAQWDTMLTLRREWQRLQSYTVGFSNSDRSESLDILSYAATALSRKYFNYHRELQNTLKNKEDSQLISSEYGSAIERFLISPLDILRRKTQDTADVGHEWITESTHTSEISRSPIEQVQRSREFMQKVHKFAKDIGIEKKKPFTSGQPLSTSEQERFRGPRGSSLRAY
jgi:hypothetical protein